MVFLTPDCYGNLAVVGDHTNVVPLFLGQCGCHGIASMFAISIVARQGQNRYTLQTSMLTGSMLVPCGLQAEGKHMLAQGYGKIINTASMATLLVPHPQKQIAYNASKAAVVKITQTLGTEWADRGLNVNCISPGIVNTALIQVSCLSRISCLAVFCVFKQIRLILRTVLAYSNCVEGNTVTCLSCSMLMQRA